MLPYSTDPLQSILTHDTVYFFMDFSLLWMPVICLGLTSVVLAVHGVFALTALALTLTTDPVNH